jgi:hypothetical protein
MQYSKHRDLSQRAQPLKHQNPIYHHRAPLNTGRRRSQFATPIRDNIFSTIDHHY